LHFTAVRVICPGATDRHGLAPYAFATSALAAFVSPLIFGAMADRHASPARVLRWLSFASALGMVVAAWSIGHRWPAWAVLLVIQVYAICAAPTGSIAATVVFSRLADAQRQFGPVRAMATIGWMVGCWTVSAFQADTSSLAFYLGACAWFSLAMFTFLLPDVPPPASGNATFRQRMGWDALELLKNHDHRVVFITIALFSIPLAAFYPFTPLHMGQLGFEHTTALMSLGQVTEIIAMFALARIFGWMRLKWILAAGLAFGALRYSMAALDHRLWLLAGVTLHGLSFTLLYITAQIYLNERVESSWRARAQALLTLMNSGFGNLAGYLGTGWWLAACTSGRQTHWPWFWGGLSAAMAAVLVYFLWAYHGRGGGLRRQPAEAPSD
jgi:MFS family permease